MNIKFDLIKVSNVDVISTSTSECEFLEAEHFLIQGLQEYPDEAFSGTIYKTDPIESYNMNYLKGQFQDQSGRSGWYHMNGLGAFVWCGHQGHNEFLKTYNRQN